MEGGVPEPTVRGRPVSTITRRRLLASGITLAAATLGGARSARRPQAGARAAGPSSTAAQPHNPDAMPGTAGEVNHVRNGFNPTDILTDFDWGQVSSLPNGQTLREYFISAGDRTIEVAPNVFFPAWTYNGRIPGPTIRCREGDRIRVHFANGSSMPHSIHFHGIHRAEVDGVPRAGVVPTGGRFTYEFDAEPFGVHLYHCHAFPLSRHIAKGLYGAFIIDPRDGWAPADREFVMVMNGIDVDFDDENDFYAVNTIPFHYEKHPIQIRVGERVRIFLINMVEFDPINSFHLHGNFFDYYPTGTRREPRDYTDIITQAQGERGILEFSYRYPGRFMFHAHKTEFAELGWTGSFEVIP